MRLLVYKPNSVSAKAPDNHMPRNTVASTLERLSPDFLKDIRGTALHAGKDFAVSPAHVTVAALPLIISREVLCFRSGRLCSHLSPYGGRGLPATLLLVTQGVFGLSSPIF